MGVAVGVRVGVDVAVGGTGVGVTEAVAWATANGVGVSVGVGGTGVRVGVNVGGSGTAVGAGTGVGGGAVAAASSARTRAIERRPFSDPAHARLKTPTPTGTVNAMLSTVIDSTIRQSQRRILSPETLSRESSSPWSELHVYSWCVATPRRVVPTLTNPTWVA